MSKPKPTIRIRLVGDGISPESVSVSTMAKAVEAVQALVHRDVPGGEPNTLRLLRVRKGSAQYECKSDNATEVMQRMAVLQSILNGDPNVLVGVETLKPLKQLSRIAKTKGCAIEILVEGKRGPSAIITKATYSTLHDRLITDDDTVITGRLERVGGATERRCTIRVPNRDGLLYCSIETKELSTELGEHLYSDVTVSGRGKFIARNWYLLSMTVSRIDQVDSGLTFEQLRDRIRKSSRGSWDNLESISKELESLR